MPTVPPQEIKILLVVIAFVDTQYITLDIDIDKLLPHKVLYGFPIGRAAFVKNAFDLNTICLL